MEQNEYPLVSYFVVSYNEEKFIRQAVQSAFDQDYPNMEIILSDDNSQDRTFDIMREMVENYNGPHKIILNQNKPNLGPRDHYCKVLYELSHGDIIVFADGDDISLPQRTRVSVDFFNLHPEVNSLSFRSDFIDEEGDIFEPKYARGVYTGLTSIYTLDDLVDFNIPNRSDDSRAIRRSLVEQFPPLKYSNAEDIYLFIRSLFTGAYAFIRQPLTLYRQRSDSIMGIHRDKKWTSQKDLQMFESTSKRQALEDYYYALKKGYISDDIRIKNAVEKMMDKISPSRKFLKNKIGRRVHHFIFKKFNL